MRPLSITAVILTLNEQVNLDKCLKSVSSLVQKIIVVDSFSSDETLEIAKLHGVDVFEHEFKNQADQFNWALDNVPITTEWILRLDADEYLTPELAEEIARTLPSTQPDVSGYYMKRRVYFMGRWMKHGGYYPTWFLRLWQKGRARIEEREVDEHAILKEGKARKLKNDFIDNNRKDLAWWTAKQNEFSSREANEQLKKSNSGLRAKITGTHTERKRWLKGVFYRIAPPFFRAFLYFIYRYFLRLGFLDGKEGLIFHFLQGFWHRFLIDAKIYEKQKHVRPGPTGDRVL